MKQRCLKPSDKEAVVRNLESEETTNTATWKEVRRGSGQVVFTKDGCGHLVQQRGLFLLPHLSGHCVSHYNKELSAARNLQAHGGFILWHPGSFSPLQNRVSVTLGLLPGTSWEKELGPQPSVDPIAFAPSFREWEHCLPHFLGPGRGPRHRTHEFQGRDCVLGVGTWCDLSFRHHTAPSIYNFPQNPLCLSLAPLPLPGKQVRDDSCLPQHRSTIQWVPE